MSWIVHLRMQYRPMPYGSAAGFFLVGLAFAATALGRFVAARYLVGALTNLLNNAVKFTRPGGEIAFSLETVDGRALVKVRDWDVGIPAETLP